VLALFTQCPGETVQTWTGKVDLARKFKCTTAARIFDEIDSNSNLEMKKTGFFRSLALKFL